MNSSFEMMDFQSAVLDQLHSDYFEICPDWAQDVIRRAVDDERGICSDRPWSEAAIKHLNAAMSCVKSINTRILHDADYAEKVKLGIIDTKAPPPKVPEVRESFGDKIALAQQLLSTAQELLKGA